MKAQKSQPQDYSEYFPKNPIKYTLEVPSQAKYISQPKNPSGFTPMETIRLEGAAYRQISSGRSPWWVMFTLWFLLGFPLFIGIIPFIGAGFLQSLPYLIPALFVTLIVWRGIRAKMKSQ